MAAEGGVSGESACCVLRALPLPEDGRRLCVL